MKTKNSKIAAEWMIKHPEQNLYDEYGNFVAYYPNSYDSPHVEYSYEIDIERGDWDMQKMSIEEFINRFDDSELECN